MRSTPAAAVADLASEERVQAHPAGSTTPADADAKAKFLAAEALGDVGGIAFNKTASNFATN